MQSVKFIFVGTISVAALGAGGCSSLPPREEPPLDCSVGDAYEFDPMTPMSNWEPGGDAQWFSGTDGTGLVRCDSLEGLLPSDLTEEEVTALITPLMVDAQTSVLCQPRVLCDSPYALGEDAVPEDVRDRTFCESSLSRRSHATFAIEEFPDGDRCGSQAGLRLTAERNNDWGCLFGDWSMAAASVDRSAWEGISFWARAAPGTTRSVSVLLNDKYTANILIEDAEGNSIPDPNFETACVDEAEKIAEERGEQVNQATDQQGSTSINVAGYVPSEDACGNSYSQIVTVTADWQLYLLPFDSFSQDPLPNRRLEGIDTTSLRGLIVRAPQAAVLDVWLDDLSYYRALD